MDSNEIQAWAEFKELIARTKPEDLTYLFNGTYAEMQRRGFTQDHCTMVEILVFAPRGAER